MCTGACLQAAARHWAQLGLGPGAHNSPAELAPAAPVARDHLVHGSFVGGIYMYTYDMRMHVV